MTSTAKWEKYLMESGNRGRAVIINNVNFKPGIGSSRPESVQDAKEMQKALQTLGFKDIQMKEDLSNPEMCTCIEKLAQEDYSDYDCFLCVLMSHGSYDKYQQNDLHFVADVIYGTDAPVFLEFLLQPLERCKSLRNKPKIFIIQACRGDGASDPVDIGHPVEGRLPSAIRRPACRVDAEAEHYKAGTPVEDNPETKPLNHVYKDYLVHYSTQPYHVAFTNELKGAYFIDAFCNQVEKHAETGRDLDFLKMLTKVNHDVAYSFSCHAIKDEHAHFQGKKQMPRISSSLSKRLVFPLKKDK